MPDIDRIDRKILDILQRQGRIAMTELATQMSVPILALEGVEFADALFVAGVLEVRRVRRIHEHEVDDARIDR